VIAMQVDEVASSAARAMTRVHDLTARRIERALARRQRYRYVQPVVTACEQGWVVSSPCCSRNIDPLGGEIPIAWFEPMADGWALHAREHAEGRWILHSQAEHIAELIEIVCQDEARVFWP
jgi:EAL domain-containing protein (putative c-di-GMP-specific phosphodiesterase class I)